jgi:hypothetical protein
VRILRGFLKNDEWSWSRPRAAFSIGTFVRQQFEMSWTGSCNIRASPIDFSHCQRNWSASNATWGSDAIWGGEISSYSHFAAGR